MTEQEKERILEGLYGSIQPYKHKHNMNVYYEIIHVKTEFGLEEFWQSLYIDVKKFIHSYIASAAKEDYGYDEIIVEKIADTIYHITDLKKQRSLFQVARRLYGLNGYEPDDLSEYVSKLDLKIAISENKYPKAICLFLSSNICTVLVSYLLYVIAVGLIMVPAPYKWMELFHVELNEFSSNPFINHVANTLALITGNDSISPSIMPNGILGMIVYCVGVILFYFFFVNFLFKKLEDFTSIK